MITQHAMRNTLLLTFLLLAFLTSGQTSRTLPGRSNQVKEKMDHLTDRTRSIFLHLQNQQISALTEQPRLKNLTAKQKLDSIIYRELDKNTEIWYNDWKDEYIYDSTPVNTAYWEKSWNKQQAKWETVTKTEIETNTAGLPVNYNSYSTDNPSKELRLDSKMIAHYNNSGKTDSIFYWALYPPDTWGLESSLYYYYHSSGRLEKVEIILQEEDEGEIYEIEMTYKFEYDSLQRQTSTILLISDDGEDFEFSRTNYTWNSSGKMTSYENSSFSLLTSTLQKSTRYEMQYNQAGDIFVETGSKWNTNTSTWDLNEKEEFTYGNTNSADVVFPNLQGMLMGVGIENMYQFNKVPETVNTFERINNDWLNTGKTTFYYSGGTLTGLVDLQTKRPGVYPNPFSDYLYFHWTENVTIMKVEIFHISGKRIIEQSVTQDKPLDSSYLQRGTYIYRLTTNGTLVDTGKLIRH